MCLVYLDAGASRWNKISGGKRGNSPGGPAGPIQKCFGYYKPSRMNNVVFMVYEDNVKAFLYGNLDYECASGNLKVGHFGEAHAEVKKHSGKKCSLLR